MECTSETIKPGKHTTPKQAYQTQLKATKCMEFSVKRPEDKEDVNVTGLLCVSDTVVVVDHFNNVLKLFNQSGTYLSSTKLKDSTWGITLVDSFTFATCGNSGKIYLWTVYEQVIVNDDVSYDVDPFAQGIHYNGTYYCIVHHHDNKITILDKNGCQIRKISMKGACGKDFTLGWDIHMDRDTNNIYVPCDDEDGVICMTIKGEGLWFTQISDTYGITDIQGTLCVSGTPWLQLISKDGEYIGKLQVETDIGLRTDYICYGQNNKLYLCYESKDNKTHIIVFSVLD